MLRKIKGQSTAEYAILIAVVIGALIAMQTYVKRGLQGRYHDGVKSLATSTSSIGATEQYEPYYSDSAQDYDRDSSVTDNTAVRGGVTSTIAKDTTVRKVGGYQSYKDTKAAD